MPTKLKGMTSLEIAIIVAIVLIIAVAVGWYLYTNFLGATSQQARLMIVDARVYVDVTNNNQFKSLNLTISNPGPNDVAIASIELAGQTVARNDVIKAGVQNYKIGVDKGISGAWAPGTTLTGRVVTTAGTSFPFTAVVVPATGQS